MFNQNEAVKISDSVFFEKINDYEMFAINVTSGVFVSIDEIGLRILQYIKEPRFLNEIIEMIKTEYDCPEDITDDITDFINRTVEEGFAVQV